MRERKRRNEAGLRKRMKEKLNISGAFTIAKTSAGFEPWDELKK